MRLLLPEHQLAQMTLTWTLHRSQTEWNLVFALIRSTISQPEAARLSFELVASLCRDGPDQLVNVDNFFGLVTLLDDFATTAGLLTESHQQQGRRGQPLTTSKYVIINIGHPFIHILSVHYQLIVAKKQWTCYLT